MIEIRSQKGDFIVYDQDTEFISINGLIVPYSEYQPVYVRNGEDKDNPPSFVGVLDKRSNSIITTTGRINKLISNDNEVTI